MAERAPRGDGPMRVVIPTKNRPATMTTHRVFAGTDYLVLVHDEEQRAQYLAEQPDLEPGRVYTTGVPGDTFGLTRQREWACQYLAEPGEWFVFADDNIRRLTAVPEPHYSRAPLPVQTPRRFGPPWAAIYNTECDAQRFLTEIAPDTIVEAERTGSHLCGFAVVDNHYFRGRKFRSVGYVIGKLMLWHNVPFEWDHTISMEDFRNTAEHLQRYGVVTINNYAHPVSTHYQPGGMGRKEERREQRWKDVERLMLRYAGCFALKDATAIDPDLSVRLRETSIDRWRRGDLR